MKRTATAVACITLLSAASVLAADAQANWDAECSKCHGKDGSGKTPMGKKLKLKDYTDATVQKEFTDEEAAEAIRNGIKEDGKTRMKPLGDKFSDEEITALVAHVRTLAK